MKRTALFLAMVAAMFPAAARAAAPLTVELDRTTISTRIGHRFTFSSTIHNGSGSQIDGLVAHLNILSLDRAVYVDPEDWSSHRTRYLPPIPGGQSTRLSWTVQAVNSGRIVVYVAVVQGGGAGAVTASESLRADVARERTLNAGGVVPLAAGVPAALALLLVLARRGRRSPT